MSRYIEVNPDKCTACRICEIYCSLEHHGEIAPAKSRIRVAINSRNFFYFPNVCRQCSKAPCVESCPTGAITLNEATDAWEINSEECIGCKLCVKACPFGAMGFLNSPVKADRLAVKCDLCGGEPQCVAHCYYGALSYLEPHEVALARDRDFVNAELARRVEEGK